jgi:triosephosphate isomerase
MHKNFFYICNWKTYLSFEKAQAFITQNKQALITLANTHQLVICPSFDAIACLGTQLKDTQIAWGAQDCSAHQPGAFSGQVLASSLKEIGCTYCIIGHAEVRKECNNTTEIIGRKAHLLFEQGIIPLVCIGESAKEFDIGIGHQVIEQQLVPLLQMLKNKAAQKTIGIVYEPTWAIGAGSMPQTSYLHSQLEILKRLCANYIPDTKVLLLYGGGVDEQTIRSLKNIELLDGVAIGHASTDFQKLQKIVLS